MSLGTRIKALRKALKLTQKALAERASVSRVYIQALEGNRRAPSIRLLHSIAESLGVRPSDIVNPPPVKKNGRFQLDEFLQGDSGYDIWHRGRSLTESEISFLRKIVDAAVSHWEGNNITKKYKKTENKLDDADEFEEEISVAVAVAAEESVTKEETKPILSIKKARTPRIKENDSKSKEKKATSFKASRKGASAAKSKSGKAKKKAL